MSTLNNTSPYPANDSATRASVDALRQQQLAAMMMSNPLFALQAVASQIKRLETSYANIPDVPPLDGLKQHRERIRALTSSSRQFDKPTVPWTKAIFDFCAPIFRWLTPSSRHIKNPAASWTEACLYLSGITVLITTLFLAQCIFGG